MLETIGSIAIVYDDGVIKLRMSIDNWPDDRLDQLEAEGDTIASALINLHEVVEAIEA
jgi:hypothetical protein